MQRRRSDEFQKSTQIRWHGRYGFQSGGCCTLHGHWRNLDIKMATDLQLYNQHLTETASAHAHADLDFVAYDILDSHRCNRLLRLMCGIVEPVKKSELLCWLDFDR